MRIESSELISLFGFHHVVIHRVCILSIVVEGIELSSEKEFKLTACEFDTHCVGGV